jgi:transcriptional regulator with XRE-family HTH domain
MFVVMSTDLKRLFGKRLCTLRESKNLKQHQLGRMIGSDNKYISSVETGRTYPSPEMMVALAKALNYPISEFYFFEGIDDDARVLRKSIESLIAVSSVNRLRRFLRHMLVTLEE